MNLILCEDGFVLDLLVVYSPNSHLCTVLLVTILPSLYLLL